jgi:hypothetical protein
MGAIYVVQRFVAPDTPLFVIVLVVLGALIVLLLVVLGLKAAFSDR